MSSPFQGTIDLLAALNRAREFDGQNSTINNVTETPSGVDPVEWCSPEPSNLNPQLCPPKPFCSQHHVNSAGLHACMHPCSPRLTHLLVSAMLHVRAKSQHPHRFAEHEPEIQCNISALTVSHVPFFGSLFMLSAGLACRVAEVGGTFSAYRAHMETSAARFSFLPHKAPEPPPARSRDLIGREW